MSRHMYCAPGVLTTLFQCSFAVSKSAVCTEGLELYSDSMRIVFLRLVIRDRIAVREFLVLGHDSLYILVSHNVHCIRAFLACLIVALRHPAEVFAKSRLPCLRCCRIMH